MTASPWIRWFHEPGETLFVSADPLEVVNRFYRWTEVSLMDPSDLVSTPLISTPIPLYPPAYPAEGAFGGSRRRWAGIDPRMMAHPLMWLPPKLAHRYEVEVEVDEMMTFTAQEIETTYTLESDDLWAVRVAGEMMSTGFYNVETGEWYNVLAGAGLDITNAEDMERVARWLDGEPDEVLDAIDLGVAIDSNSDNPDQGMIEAEGWIGLVYQMTWAVHTEALRDIAEGLALGITDGVPESDTSDSVIIKMAEEDEELVPIDRMRAINGTRTLADLGAISYSGMDAEAEWWRMVGSEIGENFSDSVTMEELLYGPVQAIVERLEEISTTITHVVMEAMESDTTGIDPFSVGREGVRYRPDEIVNDLDGVDW
jgi:hypothetical protein